MKLNIKTILKTIMTNKMKAYPNTNFRKVCVEFDKGIHPSEVFASGITMLKYGTLMQYYHTWKHNKKTVDNPFDGIATLIKDIHKPKPVKDRQEEPKKVEKKEVITVPEKVITQEIKEEKKREFKPLYRKQMFDPFV